MADGTESFGARVGGAEALLQDGLRQAAAAQKPLVLQFGFPTCIYCVTFDRAATTDPGIQSALNRTLVVRVDTTSKVGGVLARQFRVTGVPQFVVFTSSGEVADRFFGFLGLGEFSRIAAVSVSDLRSLAEKRVAYEANPEWNLAVALGRGALAEGRYEDAVRYLRHASAHAPISDQAWIRVLHFWTVYREFGFGRSKLPAVIAAADDVFAVTPEDVEARAIVASIIVGMSNRLPDKTIAEGYAHAARANTGAALSRYAEEALRSLAESMAEAGLESDTKKANRTGESQ